MRRWAIGVGAALAAWLGLSGLAQAATPCAGLKAQVLPHAAVTAAADAPAGQITACKIEVTAKPSADSDIRIEVWIPEGAAWNGRYVQFGNGGFAGQIASKRLETVAAQGYAVAMTDDGHQAEGTDGRWAAGHPQKVIDFGWRALKETTDAAKALIRAYQGGPAKYAYFQGCSDGGREALMEAQRFPDDFDGVIAGAPAYNFSGLLTLAASDVQALTQPQAFLDADALKVLQAGALAACAGGGKYIADPASCRFEPHDLACPRGQANPDCLSPGPGGDGRGDLRRPAGQVALPGPFAGSGSRAGIMDPLDHRPLARPDAPGVDVQVRDRFLGRVRVRQAGLRRARPRSRQRGQTGRGGGQGRQRHRSGPQPLPQAWRQADPVSRLERPRDPGGRQHRLLRTGAEEAGRRRPVLPPLPDPRHAPLRRRTGTEQRRLARCAAGLGGAEPGAGGSRRYRPGDRAGRRAAALSLSG
ncbi:MAG: tannase/feruloyl esterase family alpha/beta hydrolase [Caulobacteraceae bacterium]